MDDVMNALDGMMQSNPPRSSSKLVRTQEELEQTRADFIEWVDHILSQKDISATQLAFMCQLAPSTLLRILNSKTHPFNISFATVRKISEGSGYPIPRSLIEAHDAKVTIDPSTDANPKPRPVKPPRLTAPASAPSSEAPSVSTTRQIPLRYVSALPASLMQRVHDQVQVACPEQMDGDQTAFAFRMPDEALAPLVKGGMMMFATKRRDPTAGDIVLVVDESGRSKVRLVADINEDGLKLERTHPEHATEMVSFDDVRDFGVVEGIWRR